MDLEKDEKGNLSSSSCSICLDLVFDRGERSIAKLHCGHEFHLDCIGSAFNSKGAMQCPNCRKVEKGRWLYASGRRSSADIDFDAWMAEFYDISYSELPFGFRWCPFRIASLYEEGGESQLNSYHESMGHTAYGDLSSASASAHVCPYLALHGHTPELNLFPRHPSADIMLNSNVFPNAQNHNWQPSAPHFGPRLSRNDATSQQQQQQQRLTSFLHPHPVFHGLVPSLSTQEHRASRIYQPSVPHSSLRTPPFVPARRTRLSATSSSSASGSRGQQEAEGMVAQRFDQLYGWGPLPWIPLEGDPQWWGPFAPNPPTQSGGSRSENGNQRM